MFHSIRSFSIASVVAAVLALSPVSAQEPPIAGTWTLTVEHLPLRLVLTQEEQAIGGTLDYPHGPPIQLKGTFVRKTLTFAGDTAGDNFTLHVDSTASLKADGTLEGALTAHFVEFNDEHKAVREFDQEMSWTAARDPESPR